MNDFKRLPADFCANPEEAFTLPANFYTQAAVFEHEKEAIFAKSWICVGHRSEVAEKNAYITRQVIGESIIVVRGRDDVLRAFYNVCPHRGHQLLEGSGKAKNVITCPYHAWTFKLDGTKWRRVVPSPMPRRIFEIRPIRWLLDHGTVVICAGGGGIPTMYSPDAERTLVGVEAVIDKDLCSELLARELEADVFIMATDADAVFLDWGKPTAKAFRRASPKAMREFSFPPGSMGPKVEAACHFAEATGKRAAIGALKDLKSILHGEAGTTVDAAASTIEWAA